MILSFKKNKAHLLVVLVLLSFASCKQSEFYEKDELTGYGVTAPTTPPGPDTKRAEDPVTPTPEDVPATTVTPTIPTAPSIALKERVDTYKQDSSQQLPVDILWVIDDSGSMSDNQAALAKNLNTFITQFSEKDIDFKMAITTTDGRSGISGRMIGDSSKLTSEAAKTNKTAFINNFMKMVKVGITGSGIEQGIMTSVNFLDRYSTTFLRKDAYLIVMYISDEQDQSPSAVKTYFDRLQAFKTSKGLVKTYSVATQQKGSRNGSIGTRYNEIALASGGTVNDIDNDFSTTMKDIGKNIANLVDSFALSEVPHENEIQVFVNGTEEISGWTFDESSRSLKFDANSIPDEGAKIEVAYKVKT